MRRTAGLFAIVILLLAGAFTSAANAQHPVMIGRFQFVRTVDALTDKDYSVFWTSDLDGTSHRASLFWRCTDEGVAAGMITSDMLPAGRVMADYRFGKGELTEGSLLVIASDGTTATFSAAETAEFTARAKPANDLLLRIYTDHDSYTFRFSLSGLVRALSRVKCGQ